ncbi:hypothetical protein Tco_1383332 [Tanacetum coccineum]
MANTLKAMFKEVVPLMVYKRVKKIGKRLVSLYVAEGLLLDKQKTQTDFVDLVVEAVKKERENLQAKLSMQDYMSNNILHVHPTQAASSSVQDLKYQLYLKMKDDEQLYEFDAWMDDFGTNDDEVPSKEVSPELLKEISREVDEAQLHKAVNDMLRFSIISYQRDPKNPLMTLLNQDLFYLKYGNAGLKKCVPSLHRYLTVPFPENDLEELTSRWVSKCVKRFNCYARYSVKHWKNLWAKQHHIRRQEQKRDNLDEVYLESKIVEFKVNLTAPTITFPGIKRKKLLTITSKPVVGLIYKNSKEENRVMIFKEIPKLCGATLKRVLEMVKKFNMDVKHGYANPSLSDVDAEYMEFYKEYIKDFLKHHDQMRRWESYMNGRPLGSRTGRPK